MVVEEEEPIPEGASTYERFMHVLARLIKGSIDGSVRVYGLRFRG